MILVNNYSWPCDPVLFQVDIVMALEEVFKTSVEEENVGNITNVKEATDLIERLTYAY